MSDYEQRRAAADMAYDYRQREQRRQAFRDRQDAMDRYIERETSRQDAEREASKLVNRIRRAFRVLRGRA